MSSFVKDNKIISLEDLIIKLGHDLKEIKVVEELIKNKEEDIQALRKQVKLLAKEVSNIEIEKEKLFTIMVEQNAQIQKMEQGMEALLKEK